MKNYKFKIIRKFDEDILGYFARQQNLHKWRKNKTSKYLKDILQRDSNYKKLLYKRRWKNLFFKKKKKILRLKGKYRKRWKNRWRFFFKKKKIEKVKFKSLYTITDGLDFVYHLHTFSKYKVLERKQYDLKSNVFFLQKKLQKFYGFKNLKSFKSLLYSKVYYKHNLGLSYIYLLESRLEVILYRANFFISILAARQAIIHLKILVNGFIMNKPNYLLKVGDVITLNKTVMNRLNFYKNLKRKTIRYKRLLLVNYPIYLEVNYKLLSIIFIKNPQVNEIPFPFLLNLELMKYRSIK